MHSHYLLSDGRKSRVRQNFEVTFVIRKPRQSSLVNTHAPTDTEGMHMTSALPASVIRYPSTHVEPGSRVHRSLLIIGALAPVLFAITYTVDGLTRPGYDAMRDTISALSIGPHGWVQITNFVVFGCLTAISALAWRASLAPGRGASAIPVLKGVMAVGLTVAGLSLMDQTGDSTTTLHGMLHNLASFMTLIATWCSVFVFASRFAAEPGWRLWSVFAVVSGLLVIASLAAMGIALSQHADAGLFERLATIVTLPLGLSVTARLLAGNCRVTQAG